ncbi:MAG: helix-turn-helix domain-containing protein [Syntrophomonadaceae bacterium]|nr:helix-turn-helix domain-containing protein [Syntrophomonadaceae bacterium]
MENKLYSISDLSKILNLHQKTILRFIHEGKIKARKIGRTWRVSEDELKAFCHGELSGQPAPELPVEYDTLKDRISVSAVVEINEQNSEEASRISNSMIAMLNCNRDSNGKSRFDFFYYPEIQKAKYVFYGTPNFIARIINTFDLLCKVKGDDDE